MVDHSRNIRMLFGVKTHLQPVYILWIESDLEVNSERRYLQIFQILVFTFLQKLHLQEEGILQGRPKRLLIEYDQKWWINLFGRPL
jgi:hypothetical protein